LVGVLSLYLGHPTYGFSVVLVALLISTGVGSLLVERVQFNRAKVCLVITAVLFALATVVFPLVRGTIHLGTIPRFTIALLMVGLCGLPMGFPLALAIRALGRAGESSVAWAWAVNASASVVGSCLVMILMVFAGSQHAFVLSGLCYLIAAASAYLRSVASVVSYSPASSAPGQTATGAVGA
jgi:hypothetical protein